MEQISGCQAVERAITILELFDEHRTVVGVGEAARALGVHRSTASRLMATLERRGLLEQAEGSASYRLGLGLVPLAGFVLNRFPVRAQAGQVLRELRDTTGETAWLGVLDAHKITQGERVLWQSEYGAVAERMAGEGCDGPAAAEFLALLRRRASAAKAKPAEPGATADGGAR